MFKNRVVSEFKKVIGWADYWDSSEIPALDPALTQTESGLTYQSFYPSLIRLDYIQPLLPTNRDLEEFLSTIEDQSINMVLNRIIEEKSIGNNGKDLVNNTILYQNRYKGSKKPNQGRFVGVEVDLKDTYSIEVVLNRIGIYLDDSFVDVELYLFNSLVSNAVSTHSFTTDTANTFAWLNETIELNSNTGEATDTGVWYIGYYQADLSAQAITLDTFNWKNGYCGGCVGNGVAQGYRNVSKHVSLTPFYIAQSNVPAIGEMFEIDDIVYTYSNNWGLNINLSIRCDLSQYLIDTRSLYKNAIGKMVAYNILLFLSASSQVSAIEQNVQILALRALEGSTESKQRPFIETVDRAIKATILEQGNNNNSPCLPCARKGTTYTNA